MSEELIHPGLGEDDPLKRETQRIAGNGFDAYQLLFSAGQQRPTLYAHPLVDIGTPGWTNVYTGPSGVVVGGSHAAAVRVDDNFTLYTATGAPGSGASAQDYFTCENVGEAGYDFLAEFVAAALFQPPNVGSMVIDFRPVGTGIYSTGSLNMGTGSPYQLAQDAWRRFVVPLHLNGTEAARTQATIMAGVGVPPANPLYIALSFVRIICRPRS